MSEKMRTTWPAPVGQLVEALQFFAAIADEYDDQEDDEFQVWKDFDVLGATLPLKHFRRARTALAGVAVGDGWREMASAPKDGTRILLSTPNGAAVGWWLDNSHTRIPWQGWHTDRGPFADRNVNGWQPLPAGRE